MTPKRKPETKWKALESVRAFVAKYEGQELCDVDCDDGTLWRARVVVAQRARAETR